MLKKMFCLLGLLILSACATGYFANPHRYMRSDHALADGPVYERAADQCRAYVHAKADPIGTPEDPDYDGLFNECMAGYGWVPRVDRPVTPAPTGFNG